MDEIAKELEKENNRIIIEENKRIGCLLWMDDVVLLANTETELQEMLNTTKKVADKYHIVFGKEKSKIMTVNTKKSNEPKKIGETELEHTEKYKYLGEMINSKQNIKNQLDDARRKAEGALQTILIIAGDATLKNIEMEVIWRLVETCIIPIITYGGETWEMTKSDTKNANRILDNILKRLLIVPTTTPREVLYEELKILDIEHTIIKNRANMLQRLERTKNPMIDSILNIANEKTWAVKTRRMIEEKGMLFLDMMTPGHAKSEIKTKIEKSMEESIKKEGESKSKFQFLINNKEPHRKRMREPYLEKLNRYDASTIFKARTRMTDIKNNFRGKYSDLKCRACGEEDETQEHVLESCKGLHKEENTKIWNEMIFSEDIETLTTTARKLERILRELSSAVHNNAHSGELEAGTQN
jgi:hypothetical protein